MIDLRSDTVTRPVAGMFAAMFNASVGDDVYGDDPSVNELEQYASYLCQTEAALFVPSGTQSNLLALLTHCKRGDEFITGFDSHTFKYEGGGAASLGGIHTHTVRVKDDGCLDLQEVEQSIKRDDFHFARTRLLTLENSYHGRVLPLSYLEKVRQLCKQYGLALHLDGARIFNSAVKLNVPVSSICTYFDSVSVCLSKGLGAPVGSLLCGSADFIDEARRWRKVTGGGMRQAGYMAAAGLYALKSMVERLDDDHANALKLDVLLQGCSAYKVRSSWTQTNMVWVDFKEKQNLDFINHAKKNGLLLSLTANGTACRMILHHDVTELDVTHAAEVFRSFFESQSFESQSSELDNELGTISSYQ